MSHTAVCTSGFRSDAGPWTVLGADALVEDEGTYKPDFSAHAGSERLRCVRISKASFDTITSMSKQEAEAPPALTTEASSEDADGGGTFPEVSATAAAGAATGDIGRDSGAKATAVVSDEGAKHSISSPTANSSSTGGAAAGRITVSPPKVRRGITSHASLKILQAATGAAVLPSATTPKQNRQQPDAPLEEQGQKSPGAAVTAAGDAGISMVTATAASTGSPPSNLEAGSSSSGPPPPLPPPEDS